MTVRKPGIGIVEPSMSFLEWFKFVTTKYIAEGEGSYREYLFDSLREVNPEVADKVYYSSINLCKPRIEEDLFLDFLERNWNV